MSLFSSKDDIAQKIEEVIEINNKIIIQVFDDIEKMLISNEKEIRGVKYIPTTMCKVRLRGLRYDMLQKMKKSKIFRTEEAKK